MNAALAAIYGTGHTKVAHDDELDLDQISAADLLEYLSEEDEYEKLASDELDLSELSAAELMELYADAEEYGEYEEDEYAIEKMAADGTLDYFDMAGRIMAHAYADEMDKVAFEGDEYYDEDDVVFLDLEEMSGEDLADLMDDGWEIVDYDDHEKVAAVANPGVRSAAGQALRRMHTGGKGTISGGTLVPARVRKLTEYGRAKGAKDPWKVKKKYQGKKVYMSTGAGTRTRSRGGRGFLTRSQREAMERRLNVAPTKSTKQQRKDWKKEMKGQESIRKRKKIERRARRAKPGRISQARQEWLGTTGGGLTGLAKARPGAVIGGGGTLAALGLGGGAAASRRR
jgi:hypothetical protein